MMEVLLGGDSPASAPSSCSSSWRRKARSPHLRLSPQADSARAGEAVVARGVPGAEAWALVAAEEDMQASLAEQLRCMQVASAMGTAARCRPPRPSLQEWEVLAACRGRVRTGRC